MTVTIDSSNQLQMSVNVANMPISDINLTLTSQHSNDEVINDDVVVSETNDRFTTIQLDLPTDFYKLHYNGIYEYTISGAGTIYDTGLLKMVLTPGGDFGKEEYISNNDNRQAKVIYRPSYE